MKKLMIFCVTISVLAISGAMVIKSTYEKKWNDPILLANVEALAQTTEVSTNFMYPDMDCGHGTCGFNGGNSGQSPVCGVNKDCAQKLQAQYGGWWCCDNCGTTGYCGG